MGNALQTLTTSSTSSLSWSIGEALKKQRILHHKQRRPSILQRENKPMNMVDRNPGFLEKMVEEDKTLDTIESTYRGALRSVTHKATSEPSHEGSAHENLIVLLTYSKEAQGLPSLVHHLLQQGPLDILLVVDDHSPNGTREIAEQLALLFPGRVDLSHHPERLGCDAASRATLRYASTRGYTLLYSLEGDRFQQPFPAPRLRCVLHETGGRPASRRSPISLFLQWLLKK